MSLVGVRDIIGTTRENSSIYEEYITLNNPDIMLPFTFLLMWTAKEKLLKAKGRQICFTSILWYSTKQR